MASKKKSPAKKAVAKKPRRDADGSAETMKEAYKDANQRARAAARGSLNAPLITNRSPKLSIENYIRADMQGAKDAKNAPGRQATYWSSSRWKKFIVRSPYRRRINQQG